ncbi:family 20 glycosylhydrolase [Paenibacillus sp. PAMC21692]|uniref:family 20 glycosylhydrolase n=1 Tax=Paenibacillus sp. PAMC21692 TaxID=2762320 RepID=UPI00164D1A19|nr:family 20 glycosylhydrolase [Paenibacillus sp. PAMC21692]QNK59368.1 family 20 glycosylhydrolase [Paenibacillus sp. PAMC21692]
MTTELALFVPNPREVRYTPGLYTISRDGSVCIPADSNEMMLKIAERAQRIIQELMGYDYPVCIGNGLSDTQISFERKEELPSEGYTLEISQIGISIAYKDEAGAFHAVSTLKQLLRQHKEEAMLPCLQISDYPDFSARGIMLDISRDRIPTMETLYRIVEFMADLKLNQLQLYIEGFSYAYPSFPDVWKDGTPITPEEIALLNQYCKDRFIDLVPNQNSFGHMTPWLIREEFNSLSECPDGCMAPWGWYHPTTLNPVDPDVFKFLERTFDDLLPAFSSPYFNVGCDETFELGQGKSKEQCEERGKGTVYLNYLLKLHELVGKKGKKMMFWAEIIAKNPELIPQLPKDLIALEWGYAADQPNPDHCETLMKSGIPYYVCPGTSSWNTIGGFTDNMKSNLHNAATLGKKFGAIGFLNTDWGSPHHWHHLPISYPGFVYGAALSWCVDQNVDADIAGYLDRFVFLDRNRRMGQFALDLGNYYLQEQKTNFDGSGIFRNLYYHQLTDTNRDLEWLNLPRLTRDDFEGVEKYVENLLGVLEQVDLQCDDADLVIAEYYNAIELILHGAKLGLLNLSAMDEANRKDRLSAMIQDLNGVMSKYEQVWLSRNRVGGMKESLGNLEKLADEYGKALKELAH